MDETKTTEHVRLTVVEEGTVFQGSMSSTCPMVIKGRIDGDVSGPALTVMPTGVVTGRVRVGALVSQGEIGGEVQAEHVQLAGRVAERTVLRASSLELKLQADGGITVSFGEAQLDVGPEPLPPQ